MSAPCACHRPGQAAATGDGGAKPRTNTVIAGSASTPFGSSRSQRSHQRAISGTWSTFGPGTEVSGLRWLQGPATRLTGVPFADSARTVRNPTLWYPSAQPVISIVGAAIRPYPGRTDPCRQYGPSSCSASQVSSQGGVSSARRRHSFRHPSPNSSGTGGSAFIATM